jgi:IMP dehydrogenase
VLHRFWSIEDNVKAYHDCGAAVSVGLGDQELLRAKALADAGARCFFIDVANGASPACADQLHDIKAHNKDAFVCVGNFASKEGVRDFLNLCHYKKYGLQPDAIKVGVGPGSACTTRIKTGVGVPQLSAIIECVEAAGIIPVIADGGLKTPGDIAKALAAGAAAVMVGGMVAGTDETPGDSENGQKSYRGSASKESYAVQGKDASWRTAEGEAFTVACKGPVANVLHDIEGGLRSSFTYSNARNLHDFQSKVIFVRVTSSSVKENGAHGKSK